MSQSDEYWVEETQRDPQAFSQLVERYQHKIYSFTYHMVGRREDAEDLAQEVFLRAFAALSRFRPGAPFSPWLYKIAANLCINHLKRRRKDSLLDSDRPDESLLGSPPAYVEDKEERIAVGQALVALPEEYRAVVLLRHGSGLSYEEIAQALDLPLGTVKTRLFRAREKLRERLKVSGFVGDYELHDGREASAPISG